MKGRLSNTPRPASCTPKAAQRTGTSWSHDGFNRPSEQNLRVIWPDSALPENDWRSRYSLFLKTALCSSKNASFFFSKSKQSLVVLALAFLTAGRYEIEQDVLEQEAAVTQRCQTKSCRRCSSKHEGLCLQLFLQPLAFCLTKTKVFCNYSSLLFNSLFYTVKYMQHCPASWYCRLSKSLI